MAIQVWIAYTTALHMFYTPWPACHAQDLTLLAENVGSCLQAARDEQVNNPQSYLSSLLAPPSTSYGGSGGTPQRHKTAWVSWSWVAAILACLSSVLQLHVLGLSHQYRKPTSCFQ